LFIVTIAAVCIMGTPRWLIEEVKRWCNIIGVDFRSIKKIEVKPYVKFGGKTVILPNGGEWMPLLTMWLGDGKAERSEVLSGEYKLVIAAKEPWRLNPSASASKALVARGREAFERLRESAGVYGVLLDC